MGHHRWSPLLHSQPTARNPEHKPTQRYPTLLLHLLQCTVLFARFFVDTLRIPSYFALIAFRSKPLAPEPQSRWTEWFLPCYGAPVNAPFKPFPGVTVGRCVALPLSQGGKNMISVTLPAPGSPEGRSPALGNAARSPGRQCGAFNTKLLLSHTLLCVTSTGWYETYCTAMHVHGYVFCMVRSGGLRQDQMQWPLGAPCSTGHLHLGVLPPASVETLKQA